MRRFSRESSPLRIDRNEDSRIISVLVATVTNWPHRWIEIVITHLELRRLFTHLRLDIKITIVQTTTFLLWYIDIILTSFDLENVIVSIIDIYVDFNKMTCGRWRWQIFFCLAEVWLFQRYNSRKQQLGVSVWQGSNLVIIFKLTNVMNFVLFYK